MKRIVTLSLLFALVLGFTQCKKDSVAPVNGKMIDITLNANCGGEKSGFLPGPGSFTWTGATATEYINVGGSESGYLGQLVCNNDDGNFTGSITEPQMNENLYFFYLGNGDHASATALDFSAQTANNSTLTNHLIAISDAVVYTGQTNFGTTLNIKVAIARFNVAGFTSPTDTPEAVRISGDDVYKSLTIDYKNGRIAGDDKGEIIIGEAGSDKYVALIPSVSSATTVNFESQSRTGSLRFGTGIQAGKYYGTIVENHVQPLTVTANNKIFFSTASNTRVAFSKGNLQYTRLSTEADWSTGTWSFMEKQYDVVETSNVSQNYANQTAVSLFAWGNSGETYGDNVLYPYLTSIEIYYNGADDIANTNFDWGYRNSTNITNGEGYSWRTLSKDEYDWLLGLEGAVVPGTNCRNVANRWLLAKINDGVNNHNGLIIFPDLFAFDLTGYTCNMKNDYVTVSAEVWADMEDAGAIFLPAAGYRQWNAQTSVNSVGYSGSYWTSKGDGAGSYAFCLDLESAYLQSNMVYRRNGYSVRLVRDVQ